MQRKLILLLLLGAIFFGCSQNESDITAAGATFPQPLYRKMFQEFEKETGYKVSYHEIGSGGGIFRMKEKTVDFAASDIIVNSDEFNQEILHIPTSIGAVAISYNLPASPVLNLSSEILAAIFLGEIKFWNDERIAEKNSKAILPNQRIMIINRSDNSGTFHIFNDYMSKVNEDWQLKEVSPLRKIFSHSAASNREIAEMISDTPFSIGAICLAYAIEKKLTYARIENAAGNYVLPSLSSVIAATDKEIPHDTKIYLTNTEAEFGYPISSFTWLIINRDLSYLEKSKVEKIKKLLTWMVTDGQRYAPQFHYAPLPPSIVEISKQLIETIKY